MISTSTRLMLMAAFCWASALTGCGGDAARPFGGDGTGGAKGGTGGDSTGTDGGSGGTTGSGGVTGTGGVVGGGGRTGTGGRLGTGGTGTGGVVGSGGVVGGGGVTGRGGSGGTGTGGRSGTGGVLGTGGTGSGGAGGSNAMTCSALAISYANEMQNAKMCTLGSIVPQCQMAVPNNLTCVNGCITYVQNTVNLHQIMNNWQAAGCVAVPCPGVCIAAQPGNCALNVGGLTAMCQDTPGALQ